MKVIELDKEIVTHYSVVAIEEALRGIPGVADISFIESTSQVFIYCDDDEIEASQLMACFAGVTSEGTTPPNSTDAAVKTMGSADKRPAIARDSVGVMRLTVSPLHCGSCVGIVEEALQSISGVDEASVSLITGQAVVSHRNVSWSSVVEVLKQRGYGCELISSPHEVLRRLRTVNKSSQRLWLQRWIISGVGVVLLLALLAVPLSGAMHWWLALSIATVVQVMVGGVYIKTAMKLALAGASNMDLSLIHI